MNLLMLGFPIKIMVAFLILMITMPYLMEGFSRIIDSSFVQVLKLLDQSRGGQG